LRQLHSCGLLKASFQPDAYIRKLRCYMRHRKNLTDMAATHIRMMQKAMEQMNIKLQHVITDITGKTGQAIIRSILQGQRNPQAFLHLVDGRIRASRQDISKSLEGIWKEEHLFELKQSFEFYHLYREKISECDQQIKAHLDKFPKQESLQVPVKPKSKSNKNNLNFDGTRILQEITGVDLTRVFGLTDTNAIELISEVGLNMNKWLTVHHFTAWLNLAPNNKRSGGKLLSSNTPKKKNKAAQIFKMAAFAVQRSNNYLAIFYHRIKSRRGAGKAITATARKIVVIFYLMIKNKTAFNPISIENYSATFREHQLKKIAKNAKRMGFKLVPELVT
jgi:transposase